MALTMSPPQVSSIIRRIPSSTAVSRMRRAGRSPPTRLVFRLTWSMASRPAARTRVGRSVMTSSRTIGSVVRRRTARHSSSVGQGCSSRNRGTSRTRLAKRIASCRRHAPLASPVISSPGPVSATTAATRSASSEGAAPSLSWNLRMPAARSRRANAAMSDGESSGIAMYSGSSSWRTPPRSFATGWPTIRPNASQQATSIALFAYAWPISAASIRRCTSARFVTSPPMTLGATSRRAARAPSACAGRYVVPSGHTSPNPVVPSRVVTRTTVLASRLTTRPDDIT